jgi:hypothetical protein
VCKGLRAAGAVVRPWKTLVAEDARSWGAPGPETLRLCVGSGCAPFAGFVRKVSAQVDRLDLRFNSTPPNPVEIVDVVAAAPHIRHLTLDGRRVMADVVKRIRALPCVARLKGLALGESCSCRTDAVKLLTAATSLEELRLGNEVKAAEFEQICTAWGKARGGQPLLHKLVLEHWNSAGYLVNLAAICPGLRALEMRNVGFHFFGPTKPVKLPALRALRLFFTGWANKPGDEADIGRQHRSSDTPALLRRVFVEAPNVEDLATGWRVYRSDTTLVMTKRVEDALDSLPKSLVSLELHNLHLPWDAFDGVELPALRTLTLVGCVRGGAKAFGPGLAALVARGVRIEERATVYVI